MKTAEMLLAAMAFAAPGLACAESSLVSFTLDPTSTLDLPDAPGTSAPGRWTSGNYFSAELRTQSGTQSHFASFNNHDLDPASSTGVPFGMGMGSLSQVAGEHVSADASIQGGVISSTVGLNNPAASESGQVSTTWRRSFELNAHSSFTFSGTAGYGGLASGGVPDSNYFVLPPDYPNYDAYASLTHYSSLQAAPGYGRIQLSALLFDENPSLPGTTGQQNTPLSADNFSYTVGPNGRMSVTITNRFDAPLYGQFAMELNNYAATLTAVPEPETAALMLLGLGVVAGVARRQKAQAKPPSPAVPALA